MIEKAMRACYGCGDYYDESRMEPIDVSRDDEYYPRFIYVCSGCNDHSSDTGIEQDGGGAGGD